LAADHPASGGSVSPSAPTPKPQGNVSLPNRQTLRAAPPPPQVKPPVEQTPREEAAGEDEIADSQPWDERIGQVGIILIAVAACVIAWLVMTYLL